MKFEFDPAKDAVNMSQHGVSLALAQALVWDEALIWVDNRFQYDELRMVALVPQGNTLYYVAFVDRMDGAGNEERRPISLRCATRKEVNHYVKNH